MLRTKQQAIARCVEVNTASTLTFTTNIAAYTGNPVRTVYESVIQLGSRMGQIIEGVCGAGCSARFMGPWLPAADPEDYGKMTVRKNGEAAVSVTGTLAATLGFGGVGVDAIKTITGQSYVIAANYPDHLWIPDHTTSDDGRFVRPDADSFSGATSNDGKLYGYGRNASPVRSCEWQAERAENIIPDVGTALESSRSLLTVCDEARSMVLRISASGNPYAKGVFLIDDLITVCNAHTGSAMWGSTGTGYKFCSIEGLSQPQQLTGNSRDWYSVSVSLVSAVAPIFWVGAP